MNSLQQQFLNYLGEFWLSGLEMSLNTIKVNVKPTLLSTYFLSSLY